jgi:nucleoside-diphosphate-sugar epimerase
LEIPNAETLAKNSSYKILVTGISGYVGSILAHELLAHGYAVRGLDHNPLKDDALKGKVEMVYADLTDRLAMLKAVEGCDAIAHLAAIPHPLGSNPEQILHTNVVGTGYLLEAAEKFGVQRFALASTCCTFGFYFAKHPFDPDYLPLDEKHPVKPQDLYGLSKVLCEEACAAYTRRCGMTTVALRLTTVASLEGRRSEWSRAVLTDKERKQRDFWTYVEVKDCARAFRLAIENAPEGTFAPLIIAARDAYTSHDIRELMRQHYPDIADQVQHLAPTDSIYDTRRAEEHIGFVAQNTWRTLPEYAALIK